jgi:hypothetical protein
MKKDSWFSSFGGERYPGEANAQVRLRHFIVLGSTGRQA